MTNAEALIRTWEENLASVTAVCRQVRPQGLVGIVGPLVGWPTVTSDAMAPFAVCVWLGRVQARTFEGRRGCCLQLLTRHSLMKVVG